MGVTGRDRAWSSSAYPHAAGPENHCDIPTPPATPNAVCRSPNAACYTNTAEVPAQRVIKPAILERTEHAAPIRAFPGRITPSAGGSGDGAAVDWRGTVFVGPFTRRAGGALGRT